MLTQRDQPIQADPRNRYFEGVQGDNAKQGELFGINNIFTLHEDKLATKMAVCLRVRLCPHRSLFLDADRES